MTKRCPDCNQHKPASNFCKNRSHRDGLATSCRTCHAARNRAWNDRTPRRQLSISLRRALVRRPTAEPATVQHLMDLWDAQEGKCALSGVPMVYRTGAVVGASISIDRIDQRRGYEAGNLRLICHAINCFRGNMTDGEMYTFAEALLARRSTSDLGVEGLHQRPREASIMAAA
jgi:hypothetical protein